MKPKSTTQAGTKDIQMTPFVSFEPYPNEMKNIYFQ